MSSMTLFSIDISNLILFSSIKQEITLFYIQNILFGTIAPHPAEKCSKHGDELQRRGRTNT